jgi:hypothetical protein
VRSLDGRAVRHAAALTLSSSNCDWDSSLKLHSWVIVPARQFEVGSCSTFKLLESIGLQVLAPQLPAVSAGFKGGMLEKVVVRTLVHCRPAVEVLLAHDSISLASRQA